MHTQSLSGITIVSMAEQYPGPLCTRLLHELGAEVILIERPSGGDPQREAGPWLFRATAIGKKSVTLNLKSPAAQEAARKIVARSQVFVEGFRPGVANRLGLGYEQLRQMNTALVYCSISGFGQDGPYRDATGHNLNYEAISGVLDPYLQPELNLRYFSGGLPLGDIMAAMSAALGIAAAVRSAEKTGEGRYLDISITDSLALALAPNLCKSLNGDDSGWPRREAGYGLFKTSDGMVALGVAHEDHFWTQLCKLLDLPELARLLHRDRIERAEELREILQSHFSKWPTNHCVEMLSRLGIPCSRVNRLQEVPHNHHLQSRGLFATATDENGRLFTAVGSPFRRSAPAPGADQVPALGGNTAEVLRTFGYTNAQISELQ